MNFLSTRNGSRVVIHVSNFGMEDRSQFPSKRFIFSLGVRNERAQGERAAGARLELQVYKFSPRASQVHTSRVERSNRQCQVGHDSLEETDIRS